jgi:hypothetical protein
MNLRISPPLFSMGPTWQSNSSLSVSMIVRGDIFADISVKPRMSENQTMARTVSMSPRWMRPERMRSPALRPT